MTDPARIAAVARLRKDGLSFSEIGTKLGISKDAAQGLWKHHIRPRPAPLISPDVNLTDWPSTVTEVHGDAVIAACVHVPEVDPLMWSRAMTIGARDGIETLILAGDLVTADTFSAWLSKGQIPEWSFDAELGVLRDYLLSALSTFARVIVLPGNHVNNRIVRVSGGHIRLGHLIAMCQLPDEASARVRTTDLDYVRLHSGGETFLVAHSSSYSKIDGRVPVSYASKYETHVIAGNGHRIGWQVSPSGKWHGWDIGTLANPNYMSYVHRSLTTFPVMLKSFATVRSGAVKMYGEGLPITDWQAELP